jgi:hypothetical protein
LVSDLFRNKAAFIKKANSNPANPINPDNPYLIGRQVGSVNGGCASWKVGDT